MSLDNNPAGSPPSEADAQPADLESDILSTLGLSSTDTTADAEKIANKAGEAPSNEPPAAAASPAPSEAGAADTAPAAPVTPPPAESEAQPTPAAPPPAEGKAPAPAATPPPAAPDAAPQPQPTEAERALREASLQATVDALTRELAAARAQQGQPQAQPGAQPAPSPDQPAGEKPFVYDLTLPKPITDALLSEDPQQNVAAITKLTNDLGTIVHNTVLAQIRAEMRAGFQALFSSAQQLDVAETREKTVEAKREDYFKAFPAHKNTLIQPIIVAENQKLAAEHPNLTWDQNYINVLGTRVNAALEALGAKPPEAETPAPAPGNAPPARPAAMLPSGNRSAAVTPSGDITGEIMDVLDPFSVG